MASRTQRWTLDEARRGIAEVEDTIVRRLNRSSAERLAAVPKSSEEQAVSNRVVTEIGVVGRATPHPSILWGVVARVATAHDPAALEAELPDSHDEGGYALREPWASAETAAFISALAYGYPGLMSARERRLLVRRWEAVFGPRRP